jgi:hypothetical protein
VPADGVAPGVGARLTEGDGCWVGAGVGEPVGLPDGSGLPVPGVPGQGLPGQGLPGRLPGTGLWPGVRWADGRPPAVPGRELERRWRRGEPGVDPWGARWSRRAGP